MNPVDTEAVAAVGTSAAINGMGAKIRALRREKHLTQQDVCGDFITRNQLSRIETGDANPSLETLLYLAKQLGVPVGYLLSDTEDLSFYRRPALLSEIRNAFQGQNWEAVWTLSADIPDDDEISYIRCICALARGKQAYTAFNCVLAGEWFSAVFAYAKKTIYPTDTFTEEAALYTRFLSLLKGNEPSEPEGGFSSERGALERILYHIEKGTLHAEDVPLSEYGVRDDGYRDFINGLSAIRKNDLHTAQTALASALSSDSIRHDPYLLLTALTKAEDVSATLEDYKSAYLYAGKRKELELTLGLRASRTTE